jgi:hypothetical protein
MSAAQVAAESHAWMCPPIESVVQLKHESDVIMADTSTKQLTVCEMSTKHSAHCLTQHCFHLASLICRERPSASNSAVAKGSVVRWVSAHQWLAATSKLNVTPVPPNITAIPSSACQIVIGLNIMPDPIQTYSPRLRGSYWLGRLSVKF